MTEQQVVEKLNAACVAAGGQKAFSKTNNISMQYVNDVLRGRRAPGDLILAALKIRRIVTYEEIDHTDSETDY